MMHWVEDIILWDSYGIIKSVGKIADPLYSNKTVLLENFFYGFIFIYHLLFYNAANNKKISILSILLF